MSSDRPIGAVILAAGASRRFGSPKQMAVIGGRTLVERVIEVALGAGLTPVVVVVPVWLPRPAAPGADAVRWVRNPFPERGLSVSLRLGVAALGDEAAAAIILLGDQPGVSPSTLAAIVAARGERPVVAAEAEGILAPPVLIERSQFPLVEGLVGDLGLRGWLGANPDLVQAVRVGNHIPDIDTPDDLSRLAGP